MPHFRYTALSSTGTPVQGEEAAVSADELRSALKARGFLVKKLEEKRTGFGLRRSARVSSETFLLFNQEILALTRAGLTIPEALKLSANRPESPALSQVLQRVVEEVRQGVSLSEACGRHPEIFEGPYLAGGGKRGQYEAPPIPRTRG